MPIIVGLFEKKEANNKMEIIFHGAAEDIGRSCIEVRTSSGRYLMDAGLWITEHGGVYPTNIENLEEIKALFLSHAHVDHTGALPLLHHGGLKCPVIANKETEILTKMLLKDSFKISRIMHEHVAYEKLDIKQIVQNFRYAQYGKTYILDALTYTYYPSGHIPGSAMMKIEVDGKTILYTGDFNLKDTNLLASAKKDIGPVDILITECTYASREHKNREQEETDFLDTVQATLRRGGKVLVPAFAVGRAQEILLMLAKRNLQVPIYLDGMARQVTEAFLDYPEFVKDPKKLKEIADKVIFIKSEEMRHTVLREPCVVVSTSGMVTGGPIIHYISRVAQDSRCSILMTGYQAPKTNGRMLEDEAAVFIDGMRVDIKCEINRYDFSAHAGGSDIEEFIRITNPKKVILQHGEKENINRLATKLKEEGIDAIVAVIDEVIQI